MLAPPEDTLLLRSAARVIRSSNWYDESQELLARSCPISNLDQLAPIVTTRTWVCGDRLLVLSEHLGSAYSSGAKCFPVCCRAKANHELGPLRIVGYGRNVLCGDEFFENRSAVDPFAW